MAAGITAAGLTAGLAASLFAGGALAEGKTIGVSWSNFQEERWKTDEAAMKEAIEAAGDTYISADAQASASKQLTDVEALISQGADALIILAQDSGAIGPAIDQAVAEGIPVVGYDRLIENPEAFYITFDNKEVGRMQARAVLEAMPEGNYAFIKGSSADPNADFLFSGIRWKCCRRRWTPGRSRTSARPTPTAGSPRTPSATWSRS